MKQNLNEQISRMKSMMGCCKGKLNEATTNCIDLESQQGMQMVNMMAADIKELGLTNEDISYNEAGAPANIGELKQKITEMMAPVLKSATRQDYNVMIKKVRDLLRQAKQKKIEPQPQTEPQAVNEQASTLFTGHIFPFLASIPTGTWIIIGAWMLLRLLRCKIYNLEGSLLNCGLDFQRNIFIKLTELVLLDFKNLFETGDNMWNCGSD
jgi:hypothetical protein